MYMYMYLCRESSNIPSPKTYKALTPKTYGVNPLNPESYII